MTDEVQASDEQILMEAKAKAYDLIRQFEIVQASSQQKIDQAKAALQQQNQIVMQLEAKAKT